MTKPPFPRPAKKIGRVGRKRKAAGWTLLALGVIVAGVWVTSGWYWTRLDIDRGTSSTWFSTRFGILNIDWGAPWRESGVTCEYLEYYAPRWEFLVAAIGRRGHPVDAQYIELALWPVPLLLWTPAALLLRSGIMARRRARTGICAKCGYPLAGLAEDAPCPECGRGTMTT